MYTLSGPGEVVPLTTRIGASVSRIVVLPNLAQDGTIRIDKKIVIIQQPFRDGQCFMENRICQRNIIFQFKDGSRLFSLYKKNSK